MDIENVFRLSKLDSINNSDLFHVLRTNDYSVFLSYREKANRFTDIFQDVAIINSLKNEINSLITSLQSLSSTMLTRTEAISTYATIETFETKKEQLLTKTTMDSLMSKYVTENDATAKAGEVRADARKLADEMTDFGGAAMVGINQSNATFQEAPSATTD